MLIAGQGNANAASSLTLMWDPSPSTNVVGYVLRYGTASHAYSFSNVLSGNVTSTTITNLATNTVYYLAVTAYDVLNAESDYSNELVYSNAVVVVVPPVTPPPTNAPPVVADTNSAPTTPVAPVTPPTPPVPPPAIVQTGAATTAPLTLLWDPSPSTNVAGYILRFGIATHAYLESRTIPGNVTAATITNLLPNTTYYLAVTAYDSVGTESDFSNEIVYSTGAALAVTPPPAAPGTNSSSGDAPPALPGWSTPGPGSGQVSGGAGGANGPTGPQATTNLQYFIQGMPPNLTIGASNGTLKATIVGTLGAAVRLESSTNTANPAGWKYITNFTFSTPAYTNSLTGLASLFQAFAPASQVIDLPNDGPPVTTFYRVVMPYTYPILADNALRKKGLPTHLVVVRLPGIAGHDVCHAPQENSYLDYDEQTYIVRMQAVGPSIREMANSISEYLGMNWTSASQFVFTNGVRSIVGTVVKTDPANLDPQLSDAAVSSQQITIDF